MIKVGDRIKFSRAALKLGFGRARTGYFRQHPEARRGVVLAVRSRTYLVRMDETKSGQEFAHVYIEEAERT